MRNLQISLLSTAALSAFLMAPDAIAQTEIGFGGLKRAFNMTELAGTLPSTVPDDDIMSVVELGGLLYAAGRNGSAGSTHKIYVVNPGNFPNPPTLLGSFAIPEPHQSSSQGAWDMATDLAGNILLSGQEGVGACDTAGNQVSTITGNNGPIAMAIDDNGDPNVGDQGGGLDIMQTFGNRYYMGMAFDPAGDGGNGSLIVGEQANNNPFLELRISSGKVLKIINDGGAASIDTRGLVFDPELGTLWTNSSGDFGGGEGLYELDWPALQDLGGGNYSMEATGRFMPLVPRQAGMNAEDYAGLNVMPGGDPGSPWGASYDLLSVSAQNRIDNGRDDDFIGFHRLYQFPGVDNLTAGKIESYLGAAKAEQNGANQTAFFQTDGLLVQPGNRIYLNMISNGRPNSGGPVAMIIFNFPAAANLKGITPLAPLGLPGNFPELIAANPFSVPGNIANTALLFGGIIDSQIQMTSNFGLPAVFTTGQRFNTQFIYFEPNSPLFGLAASNEAGFLVVAINTVQFRMNAPSAYSADLLDPFIQLKEFSGGGAAKSITKLIISTKNGIVEGATSPLGATGSTLPAGAYFDINQNEMGDRFIAGNAFGDIFNPIITGCNGTYRPIDPGGNPFTSAAVRSDLNCGLIYGDGLLDPTINTPYNLGRGNPNRLDEDGNPDPLLPPIDVTMPPYHADANKLTEYGRGDVECYIEWWPSAPGAAYPYQTGFLASDGQFGKDSAGVEQPGYDPDNPDAEGTWLFWPQTLEFNFTPGDFLAKTFGFDMDVDGTADSGGDLAGLFVEVHLNDGTVYSALTLPDGTNPNVGIIGW